MKKILPALEIHWGGPGGTSDFVVAYLEFDGEEWTFQYAEDTSQACGAGFEGFKGLPKPDLPAVDIKSRELFAAFASRIPSLKRADVIRTCGDLTSLPREEAFYEFLRLSGGQTGTDQIRFAAVSKRDLPTAQGLGEPIRREIRKMVAGIRRLLEDDIRQQLEGTFGILPNGIILDVNQVCGDDRSRRRDREAIESAVRYEMTAGRGAKEAVEVFTREAGFTYLNRLAALKMMEARGLIQESVSKGTESSGFRLFRRICEEVSRTRSDGGYRLYLDLLFDDVARELRVLFDRSLPHSRVFPSSDTLKQVLELLNQSSLADVWDADETIGWIYQYYTPKEDRKALRDSPVPRNSFELAIRNQFYTPRYVVQFLTDNTLGRIWHEMRKGDSRLREICSYLVQRPTEIFLGPEEVLPASDTASDLSQEELLREPVHIRHRAKMDPRDLRILDPACGSGHFLLYAFDLLLVIYEEAWADPESPPSTETGGTLRADHSDLNVLRRQIPVLILKHNLHGIDIDLRATQIAALALWLRAHRAFHNYGLKPPDRPPIVRSNIVCAEPMPGDQALLNEFLSDLQPIVLRQLVGVVFEKMKLAGEAGSLLKIEEEIRDAIAEAKRQWIAGPKAEQILLWPEAKRPKTEQGILFDTTGITDENFWNDAELRVLEELRRYSRHAENGRGVARYLFAEDASRGFAFVDVCRKNFDIVLMNPPFGEFSKNYKAEARTAYPNTYNDIFAAFTERFLERLRPMGYLGAITSRTGLFLTTFVNWRKEILQKNSSLKVLADLGSNVMDEAMVEAAAYCLERRESDEGAVFIRLLGLPDRESIFGRVIESIHAGRADSAFMFARPKQFEPLADQPFVYWIPAATIQKLASFPQFEPLVGEVRQGLSTGDNFRFVRAIWECPSNKLAGGAEVQIAFGISYAATREEMIRQLSHGKRWVFHVMGGSSQPWYSPLTVAVDYEHNGLSLRNFKYENGKQKSVLRNEDYYFRPGFSWTRRAVRFIPYSVPAGCIHTPSRYMAFPKDGRAFEAIGLSASNAASAFLRFYGEKFEWPNFLVENVKMLPWPPLDQELLKELEDLARCEVGQRRRAYQNHEPFQEFTAPGRCFPNATQDPLAYDMESLLGPELDSAVASSYGIDVEEERDLGRDLREAVLARKPTNDDTEDEEEEAEDDRELVISTDRLSDEKALLSYAVGCAFGRWDIRIGRDPSLLAPKLPGPFDPLPICPPGMLVGTDSLPATPGGIVSEEWLTARPNANSLPSEEKMRHPTIGDEMYPLHRLPWDGILVDDEGHPSDLVARVREVLRILWGGQAEEIEHSACENLEVKDLRACFRNPRNFFEDHIKRYSKSRRKAPIYWFLQSAKRSYGVWLYYHRLTKDTLFHLLQAYVDPKIQHEEARRHELRRLFESAKLEDGKRERELAMEMAAQETLVGELRDFKAKIETVAYGRLPGVELGCRGWDPDLNDGVILNVAPLHEVVPWKEPAQVWKGLSEGRYDWSHVAMCFWPGRVKQACQNDQSIAIAHGLENG